MKLGYEEQKSSYFPKGWYRFESSLKIKKGKVYTFNYFSKSFVCFRNSLDTVSVFDAYCPHLGAHLGIGGRIEKDQLICPFHGWKFNSSGECAEIPYCQNIPKRAKLQLYPVQELNSVIYIYFHQETALEDGLNPVEKLQILSKISFQDLFTIQMEHMDLQRLVTVATANPFLFKPHGAGFFITDEINSGLGACLLITATPVNRKIFSITFAASAPKTLNPLRAFSVKNRALKKFRLLLNTAEVS